MTWFIPGLELEKELGKDFEEQLQGRWPQGSSGLKMLQQQQDPHRFMRQTISSNSIVRPHATMSFLNHGSSSLVTPHNLQGAACILTKIPSSLVHSKQQLAWLKNVA